MSTTMRAARLVEPGRIVCDEAPVPTPVDGELLVQTLCASVCGSDLHNVFNGLEPVGYPCPWGYPGHEAVGRILESRHPDFAEGDVVLLVPVPAVSTSFAEYQVVPASQAVRLAPDVAPETFVLAQQLGTVIWAMRRFWPEPEPGGSATVVGAGSAGVMFTNVLAGMGFERIVVSDLSEHRLAMARRHGATRTVNATTGSVAEATLEATDGKGSDLVVEASGHDTGRADALHSVRIEGRVGLFGLPERPGPAPFAIGAVFDRLPLITATRSAQLEPGLRSFRQAIAMIEHGRFDTTGLVTHTLPIDRIDEALQLAHERGDGAIKVSIGF
jgi:L-iditol 2-dehydrogenase